MSIRYLATKRRPVACDYPAAFLWPDESRTTGRANLRREVHNLGNLLAGCWQVDRKTVTFTLDANTRVDLQMLGRLDEEEQWAQPGEFALGIRGFDEKTAGVLFSLW